MVVSSPPKSLLSENCLAPAGTYAYKCYRQRNNFLNSLNILLRLGRQLVKGLCIRDFPAESFESFKFAFDFCKSIYIRGKHPDFFAVNGIAAAYLNLIQTCESIEVHHCYFVYTADFSGIFDCHRIEPAATAGPACSCAVFVPLIPYILADIVIK